MKPFNSVIIFGPTATGKTRLAAHVAAALNGAVLSFDSRQVYRDLNIGTGKDLNEFMVGGNKIPYYLIDICDVETKFNNYEFVKNYLAAFEDCLQKNLLPILCGGTGLYFDLVMKEHQNINIPVDEKLRFELEKMSDSDLLEKLNNTPESLREHADTSTRKRTIRAIEIAFYLSENNHEQIIYPKLNPIIFGMNLPVLERSKKIKQRLRQRINEGMIEEVKQLLERGVKPERLIFLGLEYKFITEYLKGEYNFDSMLSLLETAIIQYAKRQTTWYRKMEKEGNIIHPINAMQPIEEQMLDVFKYTN